MNKAISILVVMVIVVPITVTVLMSGPDNLLDACARFFEKLLEQAARFGVT